MQEQKKILSGSDLKLIAVITMLIDHVTGHLLKENPAFQKVLFSIFSNEFSLYVLGRTIGRIAFPIFAFLLTEGFLHTHDRKKYAGNLLIFALISEIPWDLLHGGKIFGRSQNVFFTLFLGVVCMMIYEAYQQDFKKQLLGLSGIFFLTILLNADYGLRGVGLIFMMYLLREKKLPQAFVSVCILSGNIFYTFGVAGAFVLINLYNQERGFIKGKIAKYAFYAFYPVHMLIIYIISVS